MEEYRIGQKMIHIGRMAGKPPIAYIVGEPGGYLIIMSASEDGSDPFFVHRAKMKNNWKDARAQKRKSKGGPVALTGRQDNLFPEPKTVRELWREKTMSK
jgi:hypothetical protein